MQSESYIDVSLTKKEFRSFLESVTVPHEFLTDKENQRMSYVDENGKILAYLRYGSPDQTLYFKRVHGAYDQRKTSKQEEPSLFFNMMQAFHEALEEANEELRKEIEKQQNKENKENEE